MFEDNPVDVDEIRAFIALRLSMEYGCYKPCYDAYCYGKNENFVTFTPGFWDVLDRFLATWTYVKGEVQQIPTPQCFWII